jgi:hypothetical protein
MGEELQWNRKGRKGMCEMFQRERQGNRNQERMEK